MLQLPPGLGRLGLESTRLGPAEGGVRLRDLGFGHPQQLLCLHDQGLVLDDGRLLLVKVFNHFGHPELREQLPLPDAVADVEVIALDEARDLGVQGGPLEGFDLPRLLDVAVQRRSSRPDRVHHHPGRDGLRFRGGVDPSATVVPDPRRHDQCQETDRHEPLPVTRDAEVQEPFHRINSPLKW